MAEVEDKSKLTRFSAETNTCNGSFFDDSNLINGFFSKFQDSFCYTFVIQFIVVTLMYYNVGRGKYWKILFYAAIAGLCGSLLENSTVAFICTSGKKVEKVYTFLINEIFWIVCEFSIPYLNLIKMKAFAKGKRSNFVKYVIYILTIPFIFFRLCIGYYRMKNGYLQDEDIHAFHGYAFAVMALADLICTFSILYFVRKINKEVAIKTSNINDYIKHSSYTILLTVDIVSTLLSICNILSNVGPFKEKFPNTIVTPFHCLKCSFILILAADALIFKYGATVSSNHASSGNSRTYGNGSGNYNYSTKSGTYKTRFYQNDISSNNGRKKPNISNITPYMYNGSEDIYSKPDSILSNSKSIIKNYTGASNNVTYENSLDEKTIEVKVLPNQNFGFLNQQQKFY